MYLSEAEPICCGPAGFDARAKERNWKGNCSYGCWIRGRLENLYGILAWHRAPVQCRSLKNKVLALQNFWRLWNGFARLCILDQAFMATKWIQLNVDMLLLTPSHCWGHKKGPSVPLDWPEWQQLFLCMSSAAWHCFGILWLAVMDSSNFMYRLEISCWTTRQELCKQLSESSRKLPHNFWHTRTCSGLGVDHNPAADACFAWVKVYLLYNPEQLGNRTIALLRLCKVSIRT